PSSVLLVATPFLSAAIFSLCYAVLPASRSFPTRRSSDLGRRVMGRCAAAVSGKSASITLVVHYYSASQGDAPMQACLAAKGDWWEASEPLRSTRKMIEDLERL